MTRFISRRRFLEDSLLGVTAAGAVYATTATAQEPTGTVAANDKLGVAIVGCGSRGGEHLGYYKGDNRCVVLYLVDPDSNARNMSDKVVDEIAATQGGIKPQRVADMRDAFKDESVDFVSCATSNLWHALTGVWALQHEKHAYIEKPGNHNIHEGLALVAAAKKYKKVVQIGTQSRSNAANINAVKFVKEGGIGEVKFARGLCYKSGSGNMSRGPIAGGTEFPIPPSVNYDIWSGPAPIVPLTRRQFHYDWHWQRLYGNGDLGNQGSHQTDAARWYLGLERYPDAVITYGGRLGYKDAADVANTEISIYDYGDKCIVFETRGLDSTPFKPFPAHPGFRIGAVMYGSEGYVVHTDNYGTVVAYDLEGKEMRRFTGGGNHWKNFVDAVVKNDPSAVTADATCGALSAAISHFGNISYYLGEANKVPVADIKSGLKGIKSLDNNDETVDRTVEHLQAHKVELDVTPMSLGPMLKFDRETNRFIDNDAANAMLTREYRPPYIMPKVEDV